MTKFDTVYALISKLTALDPSGTAVVLTEEWEVVGADGGLTELSDPKLTWGRFRRWQTYAERRAVPPVPLQVDETEIEYCKEQDEGAFRIIVI